MTIPNVYPPEDNCNKLFTLKNTVDAVSNGIWVKKAISSEMEKQGSTELDQQEKAKEIIKELATSNFIFQ